MGEEMGRGGKPCRHAGFCTHKKGAHPLGAAHPGKLHPPHPHPLSPRSGGEGRSRELGDYTNRQGITNMFSTDVPTYEIDLERPEEKRWAEMIERERPVADRLVREASAM